MQTKLAADTLDDLRVIPESEAIHLANVSPATWSRMRGGNIRYSPATASQVTHRMLFLPESNRGLMPKSAPGAHSRYER